MESIKNKIKNLSKQTLYILAALVVCLILLATALIAIISSSGKGGKDSKVPELAKASAGLIELTVDTLPGSNLTLVSAGAFAETDYEVYDIYLSEYGATPDVDNTLLETASLDAEVCETSVSDNEVPDEEDDLDEYYNLAIAHPDSYVNVREEPSTDSSVVGYIYRGAVGTILDSATDSEGNKWFYITSGNVTGYIFEEYFYSGAEAAERASDYLTVYATVQCSRLNVRKETSADSERIGYIENGEKIAVKENLGDWLLVEYSEDSTGYIAAEYVTTSEEFTYALTIEEDNAIKAAEAEKIARKKAEETQATAEALVLVQNPETPPPVTYSTNSDLRNAVVANAMQYLGNRYVHGGTTLAGGTDCSGFTSLLYAQYGIPLSRIPQGQYTSNGRPVSLDQAQPGDIVCYSSNGSSCTHVAIYIGNGQIIHSSTPRRGVITASVTSCGTILAIKNVID
ncbi:MAG: C40 family peptidase [Lachnospiraceae bacterium]|nr:C40 family peptidase [Lachnospiraceae bacterium]